MVVDLPPGTSDAPLTIMHTLHLHGFVVVTTPQDLAVMDAKRSVNMIKKMNIDILGIVENMAGPIFGEGGGEHLASDLDVPFLGRIQLDKMFSDYGKDLATLKHKNAAETYKEIAENTLKSVSESTLHNDGVVTD